MYNNKVICILKDTYGNTVGAEVELNGKTYKLRTADLKSRKFNFINATVDKNGHVRAKSGSLPRKEYKAPSKVSIVEADIDNGVSIGVGKCHLRYAVLIEDEIK